MPPPRVPRVEVIDELYAAVVHGQPPLHDGRWGMATLEVCLAMLASAREGRDVALHDQVAGAGSVGDAQGSRRRSDWRTSSRT